MCAQLGGLGLNVSTKINSDTPTKSKDNINLELEHQKHSVFKEIETHANDISHNTPDKSKTGEHPCVNQETPANITVTNAAGTKEPIDLSNPDNDNLKEINETKLLQNGDDLHTIEQISKQLRFDDSVVQNEEVIKLLINNTIIIF